MEFEKHSFLKKHLSNYEDEHPLITLFELNPKYMDYVDNLLKEIEGFPDFDLKIKEMRDVGNWKSAFSELEFIEKVKSFNPKFIKTEKGTRSPDIETTIFGEKIFFEIKMLMDNEYSSLLYEKIWEIESDLIVEIAHDQLNKVQVESLIEIIKDKIEKEETGAFSHQGSDINISKKKKIKTKRTAVIKLQKPIIIEFEPLRKKIFMEFYDKLTQFESKSPVFWVIDSNRWKYDSEDFNRVFFGEIITDLNVAKFLPGYSKLVPNVKTIELFNDTNLIPSLTYPKKDGLFFLKDSQCLTGVISKTHGHHNCLINPFTSHQVKIEAIRELKKIFQS